MRVTEPRCVAVFSFAAIAFAVSLASAQGKPAQSSAEEPSTIAIRVVQPQAPAAKPSAPTGDAPVTIIEPAPAAKATGATPAPVATPSAAPAKMTTTTITRAATSSSASAPAATGSTATAPITITSTGTTPTLAASTITAPAATGSTTTKNPVVASSSGTTLTLTAPTASSSSASGAPTTAAAKPAEEPLKPAEEPLKPIPAGTEEAEAASFNGVTPGITSVAELQKAWGAPKETKSGEGSTLYLYAIPPFSRVEVVAFDNKVASIMVRFGKPFPATAVAEQLQLAKIRPVLISNETGEVLGQSYPEKGVLLSFEPSPDPGKISMKVTQIILEPLSAEPFVLRAETDFDAAPTRALSDLDQALKLQADNARAHWLRSRLLADLNEFEKALAAAAEAVRLEASNPQYRTTLAQSLAQAGRFGEAVQEAEKAVQQADKRLHVKARALCLLGDLTGAAPTPDLKRAILYHMEAVKTADPLTVDKHPAIRVAAKEVLLDAHLGAAYDVAWGAWKDKAAAITRWLDQATIFCDELIKNEGGSETLRLRLATRALSAGVGARGAFNPNPWIEEALQSGRKLIDSSADPLRKAQHQWEMGMALYDALQIFQIRGEHDLALKYGETAIQFLGAEGQRRSPAAEYLLGRLYFRLGAAYALRDKNHKAAVGWFDKALPMLQKPLPQEAYADLGRHGETFVSMGVSYWDVGQRDRALELTQRGVKLMESAVKQSLLDETALTVAYNNLATIHRALGEPENAARFENMAKRLGQETTR